MDIITVLNRLGYLAGEQQSPSPDLSTYQTMVATWRHTTKLPPTEAEMLTEWDVFLAEQAATQYIKDREAAMKAQLPEMMIMPAILEQFKADRDSGPKTLQPGLEQVVNIYNQIMVDHPDPRE